MNKSRTQQELSGGFEPHMLIEAVKIQAPKFPWLPLALSQCGAGYWESPAYVSYISGKNPNQPGSEWQFETNVLLEHETMGTVIIDILKGQRLGGIEFVDKIEDDAGLPNDETP